MTPVETLRSMFEPEGVAAFDSEDLFGEWAHSAFVNKAAPSPGHGDLTRIASMPDYDIHLESIDTDLKKFTFGAVNLAEWDRRYQLPRAGTVRKFCQTEKRSLSESMVVNRNADAINRWVRDDLVPMIRNGTDKISVLIGGVGSGKSTLNKLITSKYFPLFKEHRIIATRVEYKKLDNHVSGLHRHRPDPDEPHRARLRALIEQVVYCDILRDIFHFGWSEPQPMACRADACRTFIALDQCSWPELDMRRADMQERLAAYMRNRYGTAEEQAARGIDTAATIKEVKRAINAFSATAPRYRTRWYHEILADAERQAALEPFAQYVADQGIELFVIFDGLDWVQISDFIGYTTHRDNLVTIAEWLVSRGRKLRLPHTRDYLYPTFQVTMRSNTYELFWSEYSQALPDTQGPIYFVAPVEFRDIISTVTTAPLFVAEDGTVHVPREEILAFFSKIQKSLSKVLDLRPRQLNDLFMQNSRYRVHFARNVLEELFRPAVDTIDKNGRERTRANLIEQVRIETSELLERKEYRLIDMLLHAKNERFANFIRIEGDGIDLARHAVDPTYIQAVLRDNNIKSGYVGNVFNYHIPYRGHSDIEFLLEKVRILDLLIESGREPLRKTDLQDKFLARGWTASPYFDFSVAILIRENMIAGFNANEGSSGYVVTDFGRMVRAKLVSNMIYLENVFFGTFLPRGVKRFGKDIYRNAAQRHEWVAASIYHCWLLLRLVHTAEKGRRSPFFEEIRNSVAATVDRIVNAKSADPRIASHALRYITEFGTLVHQ